MYNIDIFNNLKPLRLFLLRPDGSYMCEVVDGLDKESGNLSVSGNQQLELTFSIRDKYTYNGEQYSTQEYDLFVEGMYLELENYGKFRMTNPSYYYDGEIETKQVTAFSCECELEHYKFELKLNTGEEDSQERLVIYDEDEEEQLLDASDIPIDFLTLYNTFPEQLREIYNLLLPYKDFDNNYFVSAEGISDKVISLCNVMPRLKSKSREIDGTVVVTEYIKIIEKNDVYPFGAIRFDDSLFDRIRELIIFYTKYRKQLSILDIVLEKTDGNWTVGEIYGIDDGDYSLANKRFSFSSDGNVYSFLSSTLPQSTECIVTFNRFERKINITPVDKIGDYTGVILSYTKLLKSLSISSDEENLSNKLYVTGGDDLDILDVNFGDDYIEDLSYKINARDSLQRRIYVSDELAEKYLTYLKYRDELRETWVSESKKYYVIQDEITDLTYRVPLDDLSTDWSTFKPDELNEALIKFKNLSAALLIIYKNEYSNSNILNSDGSINIEWMKKNAPGYYQNYIAYENIILQITCAIEVYPNYKDKDSWTDNQKEKFKDIDYFESDFSLYGKNELEAKIQSYESMMKTVADSNLVYKNREDSLEVKTWGELTSEEKSSKGGISSLYNEHYKMYNEYLDKRNSAIEYLNEINKKLDDLQEQLNIIANNRSEIKKNASKEQSFTEKELKTLNLLIIESEYNNDNIIVTDLNNAEEKIDIKNELFDDAMEKLSIVSRPQIEFTADVNNLFSIVEMRPLWEQFNVFNYVLVEYKDKSFTQLRIVSYDLNPFNPILDSFEVQFSNYIVSRSKRSDTLNLLGLSSTSSIKSYSGGSGSSGFGSGDYVDSVTNTMLKKLLTSQSFTNQITSTVLDVVDLNKLIAKSALFSDFVNGNTFINGRWIKTGWLTDSLYNGNSDTGSITNTQGSILNLVDGTFNLGGGNLVFDGNDLKVRGDGSSLSIIDNPTVVNTNSRVTDVEDQLQSTVVSVMVEYATSASSSIVPEDGWSSDQPDTSTDNGYVWQRTVTKYVNNTILYSSPVCISSNIGSSVEGTTGDSALTVSIVSSNGNIFKSGNISTTLTCYVYYGYTDITDRVNRFIWKKYDENGVLDESWNRETSGNIIYLSSYDVFNKAQFACEIDVDI